MATARYLFIFTFSSLLYVCLATPVSAAVVINEFLPNPSGPSSEDSEWIELFSSESTDLSGWQLGDSVSLYTIASGSSIAASGFAVFEKSTTNIALNNSGDTVRLLNSEGSTIDTHTYGSTDEDVSIGRTNNGGGSWVICTSPTKGSSNNCSEPAPTATNTPTKTPTSAPQAATTSTPTIKPTLIPTKSGPSKTPTPKKSPTPTATEAAVLGVEVAVASATASPSGGLKAVLPLVIALLLVAAGLAIIAGVLVWKKRKPPV